MFAVFINFKLSNIMELYNNIVAESQLIENNYVDPNNIEVEFPSQKRNLIYIYLESMESSYTSVSMGGCMNQNLIPELTKLCNQNINFSSSSEVGGYHMVRGSDHTIHSIVAQTTGLPLKYFDAVSEYKYERFLPGVTSLGEILESQGYKNYFMIGSDKKFGGRSNYLTEHGDYSIFDYYSALDKGLIPNGYYEGWGYEDKLLFEFAKKKLLEISEEDNPFNFNMLTCDTHFQDGYKCEKCSNKYVTQYENVIACSSKQVYEFVR